MKYEKPRRLVLLVRSQVYPGTEDVLNHLIGVKSYPRGVTTNSEGGIESYEAYYPVFEAMQEVDMVLNLHGEVHSDAAAVGFSLTSKS
jgi:dihydroorotase